MLCYHGNPNPVDFKRVIVVISTVDFIRVLDVLIIIGCHGSNLLLEPPTRPVGQELLKSSSASTQVHPQTHPQTHPQANGGPYNATVVLTTTNSGEDNEESSTEVRDNGRPTILVISATDEEEHSGVVCGKGKREEGREEERESVCMSHTSLSIPSMTIIITITITMTTDQTHPKNGVLLGLLRWPMVFLMMKQWNTYLCLTLCPETQITLCPETQTTLCPETQITMRE